LYAKPENVSRAFSLNRMAINLGFSVGPALGGLLAAISFQLLFLADGITCIVAGLFFFLYFRNVKKHQPDTAAHATSNRERRSVWRDYRFLVFVLLSSAFAALFFQLFITLPLYYRDVYALSEGKIGLLLGLNGLVVFLLEMILVYLLGNRFKIEHLIFAGLVLVGVGFVVLNLIHAQWILYFGMVILSVAEIFAMPFMVTFVVQRSNATNRGVYMGFYSFAYALGHVMSPLMGTYVVGNFGYEMLWWLSGLACVGVGWCFWVLISPRAYSLLKGLA
jgi:predicted MFS family arabinose efflux permease